MPDAVTVSNLTKTYRSGLLRRAHVRALDGVSLAVPKGRVFGLLGPNGAGKTTLVKILLNIVRPTSGTVTLFGRPPSDAASRKRVGYLPEDHAFPPFLTAAQVLHIYGQMAGLDRARRTARIDAVLRHVGLSDRRDAKVGAFSKGMQQRLGLAQALLSEPDLLFLDEPTDGVDPVGRRDIRDLLARLRDNGTTIFLNSHLLSEVEKVCSEVIILNEGAVVRQGTIAELTTVETVYEITCTPLPDALQEGLGDQLRPLDAEPPDLHRYRLRTDDRAELNALLDRFRAADVEIAAVAPLRQSLEDSFIDVVGGVSS
jgi:ABC-2 type transport system ATP-binding protein